MATSKEKLQIIVDAQGIAQTKAQLKAMDKATGGATKSFGLMAAGIAGATASMYALGKAISVGKEFEASMAKVKAVSGATNIEFKALEKNAKALGATTAFTASEVSGLQTEFAKLGFTATEINKVTAGTLKLAGATGTDLATAAETAGATLRGFGLDASETGRVTNVMAASFSKSALDMTKFSESMKFVAPVAKLAGFELEGTTAILGNLANSGLHGSMAGTALRSILLKLADTNSALSKKLGGSVKSSEELISGLNRLKEEGVDLNEMLELTDKRAVTAFGVLLEGSDTLTQLEEDITGTNEATRQYAIMMDTVEGKTAEFNSAMEALGIRIFDIAKGPLKEVLEGLTTFIGMLDEETLKSYATGLGIVATAYGVYRAQAIAATFATKGFRAAMMSTGIGAVAIGAGLLAGKLIELTGVFENSDDSLDDYNKTMKDHEKAIRGIISANSALSLQQEESRNIEIQKELDELAKQYVVSRDAVEAMVFEIENTNIMNDEYYKRLVKNIELEGANRDSILQTVNAKGEDVEASNRRIAALKAEANAKQGNGPAPSPDGTPGPTDGQFAEARQKLIEFHSAQQNIKITAAQMELSDEEAKLTKFLNIVNAGEEQRKEIEDHFREQRKELADAERAQQFADISEAATATLGFAGDIFGQMATMKQKDIDIERKRLMDGLKADKERMKSSGKTNEEISKFEKNRLKEIDQALSAGTEKVQALRYRQAQFAAFEAAINAYNSLVLTPFVGPFIAPPAAATALAFGLKQAEQIRAAQFGMDEIVTKPTMILAGEAGPESVNITPLSKIKNKSVNITPLSEQGSSAGQGEIINNYITIESITGNLMTEEFTEENIIPAIKEALRRGEDLPHSHRTHPLGIPTSGADWS